MDTVLAIHTVDELVKAGYTGAVLVPVCDTLDSVPAGAIAAKLSWTKRAIRTAKQNSSLHKYLELLVVALNDSGWDMVNVMARISKTAGIPWTLGSAKERLFRPIMIAMFQTESSTKLDTKQMGQAYEALNFVTGDKLGVSIPWPSEESLMYQKISKGRSK
jgi:hypothetical protein